MSKVLRKLFEAQDGLCLYCERPAYLPGNGEGLIAACVRLGIEARSIKQLKKALWHRSASREHLQRKADGGTDRLANLKMACRFCNETRGAAGVEDHQRAMRVRFRPAAAADHPCCVAFGQMKGEIERLSAILNTPMLEPFAAAVVAEAKHQSYRWGDEHDASKSAWDWFRTLGYLGGKAAHAALTGDWDKAKHHTVTAAALLANWHRQISAHGQTTKGVTA